MHGKWHAGHLVFWGLQLVRQAKVAAQHIGISKGQGLCLCVCIGILCGADSAALAPAYQDAYKQVILCPVLFLAFYILHIHIHTTHTTHSTFYILHSTCLKFMFHLWQKLMSYVFEQCLPFPSMHAACAEAVAHIMLRGFTMNHSLRIRYTGTYLTAWVPRPCFMQAVSGCHLCWSPSACQLATIS
jgi:hypothetical protein